MTTPEIPKGGNIAWKPILICSGIGLAGLLLGTFVAGPQLQKYQEKKAKEKEDKENSQG